MKHFSINFHLNGVYASNGSACSTGSLNYSHVLSAMDVPYDYIAGSVRFSFSRLNCPEDVEIIIEKMKDIRTNGHCATQRLISLRRIDGSEGNGFPL